MSAQLHDRRLHVGTRHCRQVLADGYRAGEGDQPHVGLRDQIFGNVGRLAEHEVQHAGRQPRIGKGLNKLHRAGRCFLGRFQYDRTSRRQRPADLARRRTHREIPGRECGHDADWLAEHGMAHARLTRDHAAVEAPAFLGVPLDDFAPAQDFQSRLHDRLALFQGHGHRHLFDPPTHDLGGARNDLRPFCRPGPRPYPEARRGCRQRPVEIGPRRVRNGSKDGLVRRVDDGPSFGFLPFAADEKSERGVVGHRSSPVVGRRVRVGAPCRRSFRSGTRRVQVDRHVLSLREAVEHPFQRELPADAALLVAAIGMARLLAQSLVHLHPAGLDRVRGRSALPISWVQT